jgi:hypothetical protein
MFNWVEPEAPGARDRSLTAKLIDMFIGVKREGNFTEYDCPSLDVPDAAKVKGTVGTAIVPMNASG